MAAVEERFTSGAAAALRAAIADAGGNEVFLLGTLADGLVTAVRVLARGNRHAVPAILQVPRPGEVVIHNHPSGALHAVRRRPRDRLGARQRRRRRLHRRQRGRATSTSSSSRMRRRAPSAVDADAAAGAAGAGGRRRRRARPATSTGRSSSRCCAPSTAAFNDDGVLSVEAGTGTGKSLAYLVPAILWSRANQQRVVVSTHTINLQEQLVSKDLPLLTERAGLDAAASRW